LTEQTTTVTSPSALPSPTFMRRNQLELTSQGTNYQLIEHWVYSFDNGICADGKWFDRLALEMDPDLNAELTAAKEIPYADDISFRRVWSGGSEEIAGLSFNIFDEKLEKIYNSIKKLDIPPGAGLYYVAAFVSWGDENKRSGYQYIFKVRRK
jgi:hypothetical protein